MKTPICPQASVFGVSACENPICPQARVRQHPSVFGVSVCEKTPICLQARVRQHASALERKKQRSWSAAQGNSLKNDKFDYAEMAVTTSSMSTPTNDNGESPFSRDSLGETVIHLDKVRGVGVLGQSSL